MGRHEHDQSRDTSANTKNTKKHENTPVAMKWDSWHRACQDESKEQTHHFSSEKRYKDVTYGSIACDYREGKAEPN